MQAGKNCSILTIYCFLGVGLVSCGGVPFAMNRIELSQGVNVINIRDLTREQNKEASVYLRGKAIRQVPLVDWQMYQLQDTTGSIWVLTKNTNLRRGETGLRSCTPAGVMRLLQEYQIPIQGKQAVVLGRSILVGKPQALMLLEADATVTIAHSRSQNLSAITQSADILIAAVGRPGIITAEMVKPGAVVVDVGINQVTDADGKSRLVGDVDFQSVQDVAAFLTPVPGGIGPMTRAMLLQNTVLSYSQQHQRMKAKG